VTASNSTGTSAASSASSSLTLAAVGVFESIATVTVGAGGSSTIDFTSIPSTYTSLQIRYLAQTARSDFNGDALGMQMNADTGNNYTYHNVRVSESSSSVVSEGGGTTSQINFGYGSLVGSASSSIFFATGIIDIIDYKNTNKFKTIKNLYGYDLNSTTAIGSVIGVTGLGSGSWRSTSAITSIKLTSAATGQSFKQYSSFALYGIKGS
jgi:hypothetical protein